MAAVCPVLFHKVSQGVVLACWLASLLVGCSGAGDQIEQDQSQGHQPGPHHFVDVTQAAGIDYEHGPDYILCGGCIPAQVMTGGAAAGDYDGDGWTDLFVTRLDGPDLLYRNMGDGTFKDVSLEVGLQGTFRSNGALWGDVDNDGDLDLFVTIVELTPEELGQGHFHLYINEAGHFTDQAIPRGVAREGASIHRGWSAAFGDYDRDGYLDLHVTEWLPRAAAPDGSPAEFNARLFRNLGAENPGYFEDTTLYAGVDQASVHPAGVYSFTSAFTDLDDDGWPDLAVAADFGTSRLYWNNADGSFVDGTRAAGVGTDENGMGSALGDWDMDGDIDWFVSSIHCAGDCASAIPGTGVGVTGNRLYENQGGRSFVDATDMAGVRQGYWGWGAQFFDYDNDRDLDLIMTNGYTYPSEIYLEFYQDPMVFWENTDSAMTQRSDVVGATATDSGKGLMVFDYDNDGDLDVFVVNNSGSNQLLRNDGYLGHDWLRVRLKGTASNRDAIGARVTVVAADEKPLLRELRAGGQFLGQNESVLHFGLGSGVNIIESVHVEWPSGAEQTLINVETNQLLDITEAN